MKAVVAAFNQEKALVGAFSVIVQPVVEPMDRFTALEQEVRVRLRQVPPLQPRAGRHHPGQGRGRQDPLQLRHRQDALQHRPGLHQAGLRGESKGIAYCFIL